MSVFSIAATDKHAGSAYQLCKVISIKKSETAPVADVELSYTEYNAENKPYEEQIKCSFWNDERTGFMLCDEILGADTTVPILVQIGKRANNYRAVRMLQKNHMLTHKLDGKEMNFIYGRAGHVKSETRTKSDGKDIKVFSFEIPVKRGDKKEIAKVVFWDNQETVARISKKVKEGSMLIAITGKENDNMTFSGIRIYLTKEMPKQNVVKDPSIKPEEQPKPDAKPDESKAEAPAPVQEAPAEAPNEQQAAVPAQEQTAPEQAAPAEPEKEAGVSVKDAAGLKEGEKMLTIGAIGASDPHTIAETYKLRPEWVEYIAFVLKPWSDDPARMEQQKSQQASCKAYLNAIGVTGPQKFVPPAK